jgi:hypothetical protein
MVAYGFRDRFREPILAGTKGGTIRADRKRHARPGEQLQLFTGLRTKHCELICRLPCMAVEPVSLVLRAPQSVQVGGRRVIVRVTELDIFATFDGFHNFDEMVEFWNQEHPAVPDTFSGQHIRWLPLPPEIADET